MAYEIALNKIWQELSTLTQERGFSVKFLADEYTVDTQEHKITSLSCNVPAKDFAAVLILHYLAKKLQGLPAVSGVWLNFRELSGIEGYLTAFRKRSVEPILRKYGSNPEGMLLALERLPAKRVTQADVGIVVEAFEGVPVLVELWRGDSEFPAEANILFDKSITEIFCTEDIIVLGGFVGASL